LYLRFLEAVKPEWQLHYKAKVDADAFFLLKTGIALVNSSSGMVTCRAAKFSLLRHLEEHP
jgi:hypothetical protein